MMMRAKSGRADARELNVYSRGFSAEMAIFAPPGSVAIPAPGAHQFDNVHQWPLRALGEDPCYDVRTHLEEERPKEEAKRNAIHAAVAEVNSMRREIVETERAYVRTGGLLKEIADAAAGKGRGGRYVRTGRWYDWVADWLLECWRLLAVPGRLCILVPDRPLWGGAYPPVQLGRLC